MPIRQAIRGSVRLRLDFSVLLAWRDRQPARLEAGWNANSQHHYHLGSGPLVRSTLSDANRGARSPIFAETFGLVAGQLDRQTRREGTAMVRLIDSTPIPLGKLCDWAKSNGRIRGMKMHVVYDPDADHPRILDITDANVNDAQIGRTIAIEAGATYVFDKGYCHYGWWAAIAAARRSSSRGPRPTWRSSWCAIAPSSDAQGDGFTVLEDAEVSLASKGDSKLPIPPAPPHRPAPGGRHHHAFDQRSRALRRRDRALYKAAGKSSCCSAGSSSTSRSASSSATTTMQSACSCSPQ